jgi:hypothetical protein
MATTTSLTTTYAGEFAGKYIGAALLSGNTLAQEGVTVKTNIKYKEVVKTLALDGLVKNATCDFDPTGTVTVAERILEPKELQVNLDLCKADFRNDWEAVQMGYSAHDVLPKNFVDFLIARMSAKIAEKTEQDLWGGANATNGSFSGVTTLIAADAALPSGQEVAGTTVTASNVVAELGKIVDAIPSRLYGKEDMYIYISQNIARAYIRALGGFGASGLGANGIAGQGTMWYNMQNELNFDGVKLFVANGLGDNKAIASQKENLWFGTGLLNDHNEVKVLDMADIDGSQNVRFVMRYTAGVQYGFAGDIVTYGITNSAN